MEKELRILVVEDVLTDAELEIRELKRAGLHVEHQLVETEEAFRAALREFRPELIISDFSMPHFDGMWALALAHELVPDVPFIFVSGTLGEEYAIRALKNGATDYVLKTNLIRLPAAVERALQDREVRAARRRAEDALKLFRRLVDQSNDAIEIVEPETLRFLDVNEKACLDLGYSREELLKLSVRDIDPDLDESSSGRIEEELRSRGFAVAERVCRRKDGSTFPVEINIKRVQLDRDYVVAVVRDITERKSQERKISRLNRILAVLSGINTTIVRIRDRQKLFDEACRIAVEDGNFGIAWIGAFDAEKFELVPVASAGLDAGDPLRTNVSRGEGIVGRAIRERRPVFDNDITTNPDGGGARRHEAIRRGFRSVIALPFIVEGAIVGNFSLFVKEPNFFDDEEIKLMTELAGDISYALEHIARQQQLEKLSRIRMVSSEINAAIVRIRDKERLLHETCRIAADHGKFEMVWIGTVDAEKQEIQPVVWTGFLPETARRVSWKSIHAARGALLEAVETRKLSVRNDVESELPIGGMRREALQRGCKSTVSLPLIVDDRVVALIALFATGKGFFDDDELALLDEVAGDVSLALQAISRQEQVEHLSYYNPFTGLPNRTLFQDRLGERIGAARDEEQSFSVMMLDIERFRLVNETYGRQVGDELLRAIGRRLKGVLQGADLLAHLGGNQFAIATHRTEGAGDIAHVLDQVMTGLSTQPFDAGGNEVQLAAKAGVAVYPADGADAESLLRNAEAALNDAKRTVQPYVFYAPQMNVRIAGQLKLENELRRAVREEQFVLHYQPRVELAGGHVTGLEALIRWMHPERGLVPPGEFIQVLEDTGLILEAGRWALRRAALDHAAWCAAGLTPPRIAVNVSPEQLRRKDFVDYVKDALSGIDGAAARVDVEITESMLMEDVEGCIEKLKAMRSFGHNIAVDDFGTGYSSLSYLARLPINSLKIDRSFITQMPKSPEEMAIVSTVISLARALNLKVVAEGVETEEQANLLRLLRCDEAQGYLFAKPMPPGDLEGLLSRA
ncbi:MAG: EAL domain-containing protein [Betaproteobacteria bacterium]|nr:EAL domain-containing protein [Betaproteobacteria bacterium]